MADLEKKFSLYNSDGTESFVIEGSTEGIEKIGGSSLVDTKAREDIQTINTQYKDIAKQIEDGGGLGGSTTADGITVKDENNNFTSTNVEGALNELFQSASNGKQLIAEAITGKGIETSNTDSFQTMATNISNIITDNTKVYTFDQRRTEVANFLDNVTYTNDYTSTQIEDYYTGTGKNNNYPNGVTIPIEKSGVLIVSDGGNNNIFKQTVSAGNITIYNLTPNISSYFVVVSNDKIVQTGIINPTGNCRMIRSNVNGQTGIDNMRDLGGWSCDGGTIKYGLLYRGGQPNSFSKPILLDYLKIKHLLNLRSKSEAEQSGMLNILGDSVRVACAENFCWYSLKDEGGTTDAWKVNLECVFDAIIHNEPLLFHCSAGADRTGTLACILEALLGVSQSDIDKDYELTSFATGVDSANVLRGRNEAEWKQLINQINEYQGNSFRDKVAWWALTKVGVSLEQINGYRKAMINGTPSNLSFPQTITNKLTGCTTNNSASSIEFDGSYSALLTLNNNCELDNIVVTMGGVDITSSVVNGLNIDIPKVTEAIIITASASVPTVKYNVTNNLTNCTTSNTATQTSEGHPYSTAIKPVDNYKITNINVTMNGTDITSSAVSGYNINISNVTGNIVITASATIILDMSKVKGFYGANPGDCSTDTTNWSYADGVLKTTMARNAGGIYFTTDDLTLPAGTYKFEGEFKQDTAGASAIAIWIASNRLFKNSISSTDWKQFSYSFTLTEESKIHFEAQNDATSSGVAYLRNAKIVIV